MSRAIRAFERLLVDVRPDGLYGASNAWDAFVRAMERDGYQVTDAGHINAMAGALGCLQMSSASYVIQPLSQIS